MSQCFSEEEVIFNRAILGIGKRYPRKSNMFRVFYVGSYRTNVFSIELVKDKDKQGRKFVLNVNQMKTSAIL